MSEGPEVRVSGTGRGAVRGVGVNYGVDSARGLTLTRGDRGVVGRGRSGSPHELFVHGLFTIQWVGVRGLSSGPSGTTRP